MLVSPSPGFGKAMLYRRGVARADKNVRATTNKKGDLAAALGNVKLET